MHENTPQAVPKTASNFLEAADRTLGERGKQYDPNGKQERSMTAIVAAFNAIYPIQLTVHMGWQFMALVKMVRGATKPHIDSALDQVAYAALAAEEVASGLQAALCEDEGCPHHGTPHVCITSVETAEQHKERVAAEHAADIAKVMEFDARPIEVPTHFAGIGAMPTYAGYARVPAHGAPYVDPMIGGQTDYERWQGAEAALRSMRASKNTFKSCADRADKKLQESLAHNRSLEVQLDTLRSSFAAYACRFDLTKEYMTKEQVLAGQAKHEEQVAKLQARELMDIDSLNNLRIELQQLRAELADKNNLLKDAEIERNNWQNCLERAERRFADERAAHKTTDATVSRLLGKNNALFNEVRNLEVAVASVRNSLKVSEDAASQLQAKALHHQERHSAISLELRGEREAHQQTKIALEAALRISKAKAEKLSALQKELEAVVAAKLAADRLNHDLQAEKGKKVYVLAASKKDFNDWLARTVFAASDVRLVLDAAQLKGLRDCVVVEIAGWNQWQNSRLLTADEIACCAVQLAALRNVPNVLQLVFGTAASTPL